jgi:hypothetical protein
MKRFIIAGVAMVIIAITGNAQSKTDTVVVELANTSRVVFTIRDRSDIPTLKAYDYQALFNDIISKLEVNDTTVVPTNEESTITQDDEEQEWPSRDYDRDYRDNNSSYQSDFKRRNNLTRRYSRNTWQSFNFDLGTNNFLSDGEFPDGDQPYAVKPWGSWYLGINSVQRTRIFRKFFMEWGFGVSWYNFKFQNESIIIGKDDTGVVFTEETNPDINPRKSKLTATYLNASLVPLIDFGNNHYKVRFWDSNEGFRIGIGPYVGYRIGSYTKRVYNENGDKEREREHSNFYLNNLRYGARLQVGFRGTDLFFNYDLNELFAENRGPNLNAFSFGVIF